MQNIRIEHTMLARGGNGDVSRLGLDETELSGTFALRTMFSRAPILVTPGFAAQSWDGPSDAAGPPVVDLPPLTQSAYLDFAWSPQITEALTASLALRPGIYTDLQELDLDSVRIKGSGLAVLNPHPRLQLVGGVVYLDRNRVQLLPAGGVVFSPCDDIRWELVFPQPKVAQRLTTFGQTSWWWYIGGEYGGDTWQVDRLDGRRQHVDYNDIRVYLGLEWRPMGARGVYGHAEVGCAFDRELVYSDGTKFEASDTVMVRGGLAY
jgi:hypothetical protein